MVEHKYDPEADAIYITLRSENYAYGEDLDDERRVDFSKDGIPIGIELLSVSDGVNISGLPHLDEVKETINKYGIRFYSITPPNYFLSSTGNQNVSLNIELGFNVKKREIGIKKELTGVIS
ncbi:MAG: DUF2283 domain-containing protein [Dehalococcoidales bacterium]